MMFAFLFAETLVIKGASKPCHILVKTTGLPEEFKAVEETVHDDLDSSLKFDTSFSTLPYLYVIEMQIKEIDSRNCDITINIIDNATKTLQHTCHIQAKTKGNWRALSHKISDFVFEKIQGLPGHFSSKIAYVKRFKNESIKSRVYMADYDGHNQKLLFENKDIVLGLNFSKDGQSLIYRTLNARKGQRIWIYDIKNDSKIDVSSLIQKRLEKDIFGKNISALTFGSNSEEILFARSNKGSTTLHSYHLKTGQLFPLTQPQRYIIQTCPAKSEDGRTLLFSADSSGRENIYCIKNGCYIQRLPANETLDFSQPKLCENIRGRNRIFFSGRGKGFSSIWFVDEPANGENFENLNPTPVVTMRRPYFLEKPCPTKNGEYIVYLQEHSSHGFVKVIDVKGNEIMQAGTYIPLLHSLGSNVADIATY